MRARRLDDVLEQLDVRGPLAADGVGTVAQRIDAALSDGVRWLVVDLSAADAGPDALQPLAGALVATARHLRARRGELIVAGAPAALADRLAAYDSALRPAVAATPEQALMILKMMRPKTALGGSDAHVRRTHRRTTSLTLPRIEPSHAR